ncbi:MAG TPA: ABC transporter substrate-binding protein [bacterium]|nr:ABC transporter substrate-binding protein [bacterium]
MKGWMLRVVFLLVLAIGVLFPAIKATQSFAAEPPLIPVTAVYGVISTDPTYLWVANERGFFKKNGLDVDLTHIPTAQAIQALIGGKVQFSTTGMEALDAALSGADTVYIMIPIKTFVLSIYGRPDIAGVKGLVGKTIGATNKGSATDMAGRLVLKQNGLTPDVDVKFAYLKELPALVGALKEGMIDAAIITPPNTLRARNLGMKELLNIQDLRIPFAQHTIATTRSYIRTQPEAVRRYVRSAMEGLDYTLKNREEALSVMSKYTKTTDAALLKEAYDAYAKAWERNPMPSQAAIESLLAASLNPKAKGARWDQFVDDRFVKEVAASGAIK